MRLAESVPVAAVGTVTGFTTNPLGGSPRFAEPLLNPGPSVDGKIFGVVVPPVPPTSAGANPYSCIEIYLHVFLLFVYGFSARAGGLPTRKELHHEL